MRYYYGKARNDSLMRTIAAYTLQFIVLLIWGAFLAYVFTNAIY